MVQVFEEYFPLCGKQTMLRVIPLKRNWEIQFSLAESEEGVSGEIFSSDRIPPFIQIDKESRRNGRILNYTFGSDTRYVVVKRSSLVKLYVRTNDFPVISTGDTELDDFVNHYSEMIQGNTNLMYSWQCSEIAREMGVPFEVALSFGNKRDIGNFKATVKKALEKYDIERVVGYLEEGKTDDNLAERVLLSLGIYIVGAKKPQRLCKYVLEAKAAEDAEYAEEAKASEDAVALA